MCIFYMYISLIVCWHQEQVKFNLMVVHDIFSWCHFPSLDNCSWAGLRELSGMSVCDDGAVVIHGKHWFQVSNLFWVADIFGALSPLNSAPLSGRRISSSEPRGEPPNRIAATWQRWLWKRWPWGPTKWQTRYTRHRFSSYYLVLIFSQVYLDIMYMILYF